MKTQHRNSINRTKVIAVIFVVVLITLFLFQQIFQQQKKEYDTALTRQQTLEFHTHALDIESIILAYRAARRDSALDPTALTPELLQQHRYLKPSVSTQGITFTGQVSFYDMAGITMHDARYNMSFCYWLISQWKPLDLSEYVFISQCGNSEISLFVEV